MSSWYALKDATGLAVARALEGGWKMVEQPDQGSVVIKHVSLELRPDDAPGDHVFCTSDVYLTIWHREGAATGVRMTGPAYSWETPEPRVISPRRAQCLLDDLGRAPVRPNPHHRYRRPRRRANVLATWNFWSTVLCVAVALAVVKWLSGV